MTTKTKTKTTRPVARIADLFARCCERCQWFTDTGNMVCRICGGATVVVLGPPK